MDKARLVEEIDLQITNLERLNGEMNELLAKITEEPSFIEIRACASILQDFYSGIEKIFERIAVVIDKNLPEGETWHIELLSQMAKPFAGIRPPVISENLFKKLKEYLKLRHLFRHIYGFELRWKRLKPWALSMNDVLDEIKENIKKFIDNLESTKSE